MRIRGQFYILVGGILLTPLLVMAGTFGLLRSRQSEPVKMPGYEEVAKLSGGAFDRESWDRLAKSFSHAPPDMDFAVLNTERLVVFSTIDAFGQGEAVPDAELLGYIRDTSADYFYQIDAPERLGTGGVLVLTRVDRGEWKPPSGVQVLFGTLAALMTVLFLFSAGMSLLIARSITRSVTELDAVTRRIASGELDRAISIRGSNEITSLAASLNTMRLALKDDQARRSRFIMGVTHDLKTPLALIKGYAEAIGDGMADAPGDKERYVGVIGAKVDQLAGMIDDLVDFVRVDSAEWRRKLSTAPLAPFLRGLCRRLEADAELLGRRAEVAIDLPPGLEVAFDERLVTRAIENVVNNALRYTAEGGLVRVSAHVEPPRGEAPAAPADRPGEVVIEIRDDGPGIAEADLERIFDPFFRGSSSRREEGMGLGLSVVKGVIDSHGWRIAVSSRPGSGSVFSILIPLA